MIRLAFVAAAVVAVLHAQSAEGHASVSGTVVRSTDGEPLRKAQVALRVEENPKGESYVTVTDSDGRFQFKDVDPGTYSISSVRDGYTLEVAGAPGVPAPRFKLDAGQVMKDVKVRMVPMGVITGRVIDSDGDPVRGANVEAVEILYRRQKELYAHASVQSNNTGDFRLFGLRPGTYLVRASLSNEAARRSEMQEGSHEGFVQTYFPDTTLSARAAPIDVAAGAVLQGFDVRLQKQARYSVSGKAPVPAKGPEGRNSFWLQMATRDDQSRPDFPLMMNDQKFEFQDVSPGSYVIIGTITAGGKEFFIHQPVEVENADVENLNLELLPAIELSGTVRKEGNPSTKMPDGLRVMLDSDIGFERTPVAQVKPDGSFAFENVRPGAYELMMGPLDDMYIKTVRLGDDRSPDTHIDLSKGAAPLEIVLASDVGEVEGTVQKANGDPAARVEVTLIPEGAIKERRRLAKFDFTDEKGKFHLRHVVPGEYRIFAWLDAPSEAVADPDFRTPYEKRGVSLKVDPNGHATVDLTAISTKESGPPSP